MQKIYHLAHLIWQEILSPDSWAIDATCGNGKDTIQLAQLVPKGGVIALDVQAEALKSTRSALGEDLQDRVHLFQQSHDEFPSFAYKFPIALIVYNLGYLPGGDKSLTTQCATTVKSLENALALIAPGGLISITCYPGHTEGAAEQKVLLERASRLDPAAYSVFHYHNLLNPSAPSLLLIKNLLKSKKVNDLINNL